MYLSLPKRKHNRFFSLLKYIFQIFYNFLRVQVQNQILGIKFIASGKLQGNRSTRTFKLGLFLFKVLKKIEFSKFMFTLYGALVSKFGCTEIRVKKYVVCSKKLKFKES
jgi:hypothetical protein